MWRFVKDTIMHFHGINRSITVHSSRKRPVTLELASLPRPCRAIVIGASGGIGAALVDRIHSAGIDVAALSRRPRDELRQGVTSGSIDVTDDASIATAFDTLASGPPLRLVIVASGLLHDPVQQPEKSMRTLDSAWLARSFAVNTIGPALVAKHAIPIFPRRGRCLFAVLSARVGSIGDNRLGGWHGYRASKAALNQMIRTLAIETARTMPDLVLAALHPGTVATGLSAPFRNNVEPERLFAPDEAAGYLLRVLDGLTAADSGGFFAWDGSEIPF